MLVSIKQTLAVLDVLKASLKIPGSFGGYSLETRSQLIHEIINQQSNDLVDIMTEDTYRDWQVLPDNSPQDFEVS